MKLTKSAVNDVQWRRKDMNESQEESAIAKALAWGIIFAGTAVGIGLCWGVISAIHWAWVHPL